MESVTQIGNQIQNAILFTIITMITSQITNIFNFLYKQFPKTLEYIKCIFDKKQYEITFISNEYYVFNEKEKNLIHYKYSKNYHIIKQILNNCISNTKNIENIQPKFIGNLNTGNGNGNDILITNDDNFDIMYNNNLIKFYFTNDIRYSNSLSCYLQESYIKIVSEISINHITNFIDTKYKEIKNKDYKYYFCNQSENSNEFSKYKLKYNKTFNDIYIPEKEQILYLLEKFNKKQLQNLSFLLYGQPGCGKSSLIKIIGNITQRHIINVKLSNIKNLSELMNIFFDETISTCYADKNKRIYIFEDIDAETDIVFDRNQDDLVSMLNSKNIDKEVLEKFLINYNTSKSNLKLADILNVFQGIVELHDTIIIITTNNIQKLDPALIRPGRINMQLELKKMIKSEMMKMFAYKYKTNKFEYMFDFVKDYTWTPAQIEEFIYESDTIEILADRLLKETKKN